MKANFPYIHSMSQYVRVYISICLHVYIYIYIHTYIHMCIYVYRHAYGFQEGDVKAWRMPQKKTIIFTRSSVPAFACFQGKARAGIDPKLRGIKSLHLSPCKASGF